jgi:TctA family transporter
MILVIYILKTEISLWVFQTILWIISLIITAYFATKRNTQNRIKMLWIFWILNFVSFLFLWIDFNIIILSIFSLVSILISPAFDISQTVFTLKYMSDSKGSDKSFLPKMMFREVILIVSRTSFFIIFWALFYLWFDEKIILRIVIYYTGIIFLATALFATLEEKRLKNIEIS